MGKNLNTEPNHYSQPTNCIEGHLDGSDLKIGIVCAKFNQTITKSLLMGAVSGLTEHGVFENNIVTHFVPGAFEVPLIVDSIFPNFAAIGFCGAFTTFSTYSLDALKLLLVGNFRVFALYVLLMNILTILMCWVGLKLSELTYF